MGMFKTKKLSALVLAALLAASMGACSSSGPSPSAPASQDEQSVTQGGTPEAGLVVESPDVREDGIITITHMYGETRLAVNPVKIVCFDLGITDVLDTLGIEVGARPNSVLPAHLAHLDSIEYVNAGSMKEADFEAINEFGPDAIFISGRLSSAYDELSKIAPTVYFQTPGADYMADFTQNLELLGAIFPEKADELAEKGRAIEEAVAELAAKAEASGLKALIAMANDGSLSFFGSGSRYGVIHDSFGFAAIDNDIDGSTHGQESNFEYISETNPDVLFVIDRSAAIGADGATGAAALLDNDLVNKTTAAQNGKIIYLSSDIWYLAVGGIESTQIMIEEAASAID